MKKSLLFICLIILATSCSGQDKIIPTDQMPAKAQSYISKHFPDIKIQYVMLDAGISPSYEVLLENSSKVEFDKNGNCTKVEAKIGHIPHTIIPEPILNYILQNHPDKNIMKMEYDKKYYEIELSNGWELKFDKEYRLYEIDD